MVRRKTRWTRMDLGVILKSPPGFANKVQFGLFLRIRGIPLPEGDLSISPAAFQTIHAQFVVYRCIPFSFISFVFRSMKCGLAAILAPFLLVEVYSNHGRIQRALEV